MMSIEYIQAIADEATTEAKTAGTEPLVLDANSDEEMVRSIPNLGNYVAPGWELVDDLFVDSSGFGAPGEPALTFSQFLDKVRQLSSEEETGFGIRQAGQFQVYIGVYRRTS